METKEKIYWGVVIGILILIIVYSCIGIYQYKNYGWDYCVGIEDKYSKEINIHCFNTSGERQDFITTYYNTNIEEKYINEYIDIGNSVFNYTGDTN